MTGERDLPKCEANNAPTRRDVVLRTPDAFGFLAALAALWPLFSQIRPRESLRPSPTLDVDVAALAPGDDTTVMHRGKPIFIRRMTGEEIDAAQDVALDDLKDADARNANHPGAPATLANRLVDPARDVLVMEGICTHLGCVPLGESGNYGGWFCPCHGAHFDTAGRVRSGPAPENMAVPLVSFADEGTVRLE